MNPTSIGLVLPIVGMLIPIIIVPTILILKHARRERELEHLERMKALELGRSLPQDEPWWTPARICVAIGAGVPIGVFLCALMASVDLGFHDGIWVAATGVGFTSVISGAYLTARHFQLSAQRNEALGTAKPVADDHEFMGRRA